MVADLVPEAQREPDPAIVSPVRALHARLAIASGGPARPSRLVVARQELVNAFAAPGGTVVVTTGLLRALRTPEELAALLAHELGHVRRAHPLRGLIRQLSLQALLALVAGDVSTLSASLRVAGQLGGLSYSRAFEYQADDDAVALLTQQGVPPASLAQALERISRSAAPGVEVGFLSTHPATRDRIRRIARAASHGPGDAARIPPAGERSSGCCRGSQADEPARALARTGSPDPGSVAASVMSQE